MATLTKAIPQDRYISINSVNIGDVAVAGRSFGGLVFTDGDSWTPNADLKDDKGLPLPSEMPDDYLVVIHTAGQALKYFASGSDEVKFAERYFSFLTPAGDMARTLTYAKVKEGETADVAFERVIKGFTNFGSFCFVQPITCEEVVDVAIKNATYNYRCLFAQSVYGDGSESESEEVTDATLVSAATPEAFNAYLRSKSEAGINGFVKVFGGDALSAQMPMALFAATDYNAVNTAPNPMFKQYPLEEATVWDIDRAAALDAINFNYNGRTQQNGSTIAFYQRGRNDDGEDTAVYCNEIWLKSAVASAIMDLLLTTNRVDAGAQGEALIYTVIDSVARQGLDNGVIEVGKPLTTAQRMKVTQRTGNSEAWQTVQESGYWISVQIVQSDGTDGVTQKGDYKAVYQLVYSKGDSIKFVEGSHYLV